ncbi:MAG: ATP-dependent RecD-like DNA helicase [Clostridia bacterium]
MVIEGQVEEIVFRNEENGYTVALLSHATELTVVVGKVLILNIGENMRLTGNFTTNLKYGEQFVFTNYEIIIPSESVGIEKYLASGLIKGVGPVTAKRIVNEFGDQTLQIMEYNPKKLECIKGISKKKAVEIGKTFADVKRLQNTVIFLQKYNITTNLALKIYDAYADRTIEIVRENPYRLVEDVAGIGFVTADKIATSMGIAKNSPFRMRAGILHILNEAGEKDGHTFLPKARLCAFTFSLLDLCQKELEQQFEKIIKSLKEETVIVEMNKGEYNVIMTSKMYFYENMIAGKLAMLSVSSQDKVLDVSNEIAIYEKINNIKLHTEQKNAIQTAVEKGVSVITGGPGTGKTTIICCILNVLKQANNKVLLLAPTGRAAKRLSETTNFEAKTIHRALEIDFKDQKSMFKHNENDPLLADAIIVDEVSMVDVALMTALVRAMPRDCKLVLVGDKDQLPSVGAGNVLDDIIKSKTITVCQLTQIFRQNSKSLIITNAHAINMGNMPIIDNSSEDFFFDKKDGSEEIKTSVVNMVSFRLPKYLNISADKIQVLSAMKNGNAGVENLNVCLQQRLNPPSPNKREVLVGQTIFREYDKVMQITNNYNLEWVKKNLTRQELGAGVFNGDIGTISHIQKGTLETDILFEDGRSCRYSRSDLLELKLAYAITIHKSQGSEFDVVVIPVTTGSNQIMTRNLIYTAVTRAKKMVVIVGSLMGLKQMVDNNKTVKRFTMLSTLLIEQFAKANKLFGEKT